MDHPTPIPQEPVAPAPLSDLDSVVAEVGASYPMMAYAAEADPDEEAEAVDALILAGLVSP